MSDEIMSCKWGENCVILLCMTNASKGAAQKPRKSSLLPVLIEKDEDGFFVVECPVFDGCYTQGKTLDEAMKNIEEVIELLLEDEENQEILKEYGGREFTFATLSF